MKKITIVLINLLLIIFLLSIFNSTGWADSNDYDAIDFDRRQYSLEDAQQRFGVGEEIKLRVTYMGLTAGYITIWTEEADFEGRPVYRLNMKARTQGMVEWFYSVRDTLVSYMDVRGLFSWGYDYHKNHNKDKEVDEVRYDPRQGFVYREGEKEGEMPLYTQDVLSAIFYLRTRELKVGQVHSFPVHVGDNSYYLELKVEALEEVPTKDEGWLEAFRIVPRLKDEEDQEKLKKQIKDNSSGVRIWLSNDERKIPLQIAIPARVASLYGYIDSYQPGIKK